MINYLHNFTLNYPNLDKERLRDYFPKAHITFDNNFHIIRRIKNIIFEFFNFEGPTINNFLEKSTGQLINVENTINNQHQDLRIIYGNIDY